VDYSKAIEKEIGDDKNKVHYTKYLMKEHKIKKLRGVV
jgi:hypothetical protein